MTDDIRSSPVARAVRARKQDSALKPAALPRLQVDRLGPIPSADVTFGDLTVIVGPQATGKSIFLQTLKLLIDRDHIHDTFRHHNVNVSGRVDAFLEGYFGGGMAGAWDKDRSGLTWNGKKIKLPDYASPGKAPKGRVKHERLFYIPAQRVMSLPGGVSQNFGQFNFGDPYTLRSFSDAVHDLIQNEFGAKGDDLFPSPRKLNDSLRGPIHQHLFGGGRLLIDESNFTKRLALQLQGQSHALGFLSWSAGQREFTPLLMGLYWLCQVRRSRRMSGASQDEEIEWVVIEEPEMGLHPQGIAAVLLLVLELLRRNYRVVVSTHSPVVLELIWALQELKQLGASEKDVRNLFNLKAEDAAKGLARAALAKDYRVYFFDRQSPVRDISALDPGALETAESEWGGITGFSARVNATIAAAVNRAGADNGAAN
jgi:energy-coupling factor transporter ATP-binding protein EcfA2